MRKSLLVKSPIEKIQFWHVFLFLALLLVLSRCGNRILDNLKRIELAQRLGVDIDAYPYSSSFPFNYFFVTLKPGITTIKEVHEIVREYELVLHCRRSSEVYYYYSKYDDEALRFMIMYNENGKYSAMLGEDNNSNTLYTEGCVPGLLHEREFGT